ncbi:MAG: FAD-dependent oxidoreductase, partial [Planctomycetes bacterium]|nr:FAD-dependent oxidoreductase [Planctomycetota bacterium]
GWDDHESHISVRTQRATYEAGHVIFTAGAWTSKLLGDIGVELEVTRHVIGWVWPKKPELFELGTLPIWGIDDPTGYFYYGFPLMPGVAGMKIARHYAGRSTTIDTIDRTIHPADEDDFRPAISKLLPDSFGSLLSMGICLYTNSPDHHFIVEHPKYGSGPGQNRTVYFANDGGIQRANNIYTVTTNSGWTNLANNLGITQFYGGAAAPDGSVILGGSQDNDQSRYRPTDGAQAWLQPSTGDGGYAAVDYNSPFILYGERTQLTIRKSTDGGNNFSGATTGLGDAGGNALFIAPFVMDPTDPTILVAGGQNIWRTTNSAGNWQSIRAGTASTCAIFARNTCTPSTLPCSSTVTCPNFPAGQTCVFPLCSAIDISSQNSTRIWVGYNSSGCRQSVHDGRVSRTTTSPGNTINNATWVNVNIDDAGVALLPNRWVTDIAINPLNDREVFVTFGGYNNNSIWFTADEGATWELRQGTGPNTIPTIHVSTIRFHPTNTNWVYVGTDLGVFASEDKGLNWNRAPLFSDVDHEGPVNVEISELFWQGNDFLMAATFGRGMYRVGVSQTVHVDLANNSGVEDGTQANPFDMVQEGIDAAVNGSYMRISAGDYDESGTTVFSTPGLVVPVNGTVTIH